MFRNLTIRGPAAQLAFGGYQVAADLRTWRIVRGGIPGGGGPITWTLYATVAKGDPFWLRQPGLRFHARPDDGLIWPVVGQPRIVNGSLTAQLGPPQK